MSEQCYHHCVIAVTFERNTYVVQIPPALELALSESDQLDDFFWIKR
jgi:hypothetical protein